MIIETGERIFIDVQDVQRQFRARQWRKILDSFYYQSNYNIPEEFQFGRIEWYQSNRLRLGRFEADPSSGARTTSHLARNPMDAYLVVLADQCPITLTQHGRIAQVQRRSFSFVSTAEPSSFHQAQAGVHQSMLIPGDLLRQLAPRIEDCTAIPFGRQPLHEMFYMVALEWFLNAPRLLSPSRDLIDKSILDLLGLAIDGADQESTESAVQWAHRRRIDRIIGENYASILLNPALIARRMKLSPGRIRAILAAQGTTLSRLIKERRLAEVLRLYGTKAGVGRSLHAIAQAVGYPNSTKLARDMQAVGGYSSPSSA